MIWTADTQVCIVGGGPAGLTLALLLLRSGRSVTLLEKARSTRREYRGEILQPGGQEVLDQLGVLGPARDRGSYEHAKFQLLDRGKVQLEADYRRLPGPFNCLLSLPQQHLLDALLAACQRYDEFTQLAGTRVSRLLIEGGQVRGVAGDGPDGEVEVTARCVVAADGRYSKVRQLAGIESVRQEAFDQDVLWFKLPDSRPGPSAVQVHRSGASPVLVYHSFPSRLQFGWTLAHGSYPTVAGRGVGHIRDEIARAVPQYADVVQDTIGSLADLSLLDVFSAQAETWAADGLVLIGDSAHTHGPIGAQGINLAVQDAVLLHPILLAALESGDVSRAALGRFETARRPAIASVLKLQALQGRAMLSTNKVADTVRPGLARAVSHTPLYRKILHRLAYGDVAVRVHEEISG